MPNGSMIKSSVHTFLLSVNTQESFSFSVSNVQKERLSSSFLVSGFLSFTTNLVPLLLTLNERNKEKGLGGVVSQFLIHSD